MVFHKISTAHGLGDYCREAVSLGVSPVQHWSLGGCKGAGYSKLVGFVAPPDKDAVYVKKVVR